LTISTEEGITAQTKEHVHLARGVGVVPVVVYITDGNTAAAGQLVDVESLKEAVCDLLAETEVDEYCDTPIVDTCDSRCNSIAQRQGVPDNDCDDDCDGVLDLVGTVVDHFSALPSDADKDFVVPVLAAYNVTGRGITIATGHILEGTIQNGEEIQLFGKDDVMGRVVDVYLEPQTGNGLPFAKAGDHVGLNLRGGGIETSAIKRGMVLVKPGSDAVALHSQLQALIYILKKEEGGLDMDDDGDFVSQTCQERQTPFHNKCRPQFHIHTADITCEEVSLLEGESRKQIYPGEYASVQVKLIAPVAIKAGMRFAIREGGRTVGAGHVTVLK